MPVNAIAKQKIKPLIKSSALFLHFILDKLA